MFGIEYNHFSATSQAKVIIITQGIGTRDQNLYNQGEYQTLLFT